MTRSTKRLLPALSFTTLFAAAAYAADGTGDDWWCYANATSCRMWNGGHTKPVADSSYSDCLDISNGWQDWDYVQTHCNN